MTPTPTQVSRLLALPIEARRKLAERDGPGWLVYTDGSSNAFDDSILYRSLVDAGVEGALACGWFPADSVAWMEAAFGDEWGRARPQVALPTTPIDPLYSGQVNGVTFYDRNPIDAALSALEAQCLISPST